MAQNSALHLYLYLVLEDGSRLGSKLAVASSLVLPLGCNLSLVSSLGSPLGGRLSLGTSVLGSTPGKRLGNSVSRLGWRPVLRLAICVVGRNGAGVGWRKVLLRKD